MEWNATERPYPANVCVHELFEAQADRTPDAVALSCEGEQLSYGELNAQANRLARHLRALGVGPDVRVGVCLERSIEMVVALLAVLKAGGAYVPLDPGYPAERLASCSCTTARRRWCSRTAPVADAVHELLRRPRRGARRGRRCRALVARGGARSRPGGAGRSATWRT